MADCPAVPIIRGLFEELNNELSEDGMEKLIGILSSDNLNRDRLLSERIMSTHFSNLLRKCSCRISEPEATKYLFDLYAVCDSFLHMKNDFKSIATEFTIQCGPAILDSAVKTLQYTSEEAFTEFMNSRIATFDSDTGACTFNPVKLRIFEKFDRHTKSDFFWKRLHDKVATISEPYFALTDVYSADILDMDGDSIVQDAVNRGLVWNDPYCNISDECRHPDFPDVVTAKVRLCGDSQLFVHLNTDDTASRLTNLRNRLREQHAATSEYIDYTNTDFKKGSVVHVDIPTCHRAVVLDVSQGNKFITVYFVDSGEIKTVQTSKVLCFIKSVGSSLAITGISPAGVTMRPFNIALCTTALQVVSSLWLQTPIADGGTLAHLLNLVTPLLNCADRGLSNVAASVVARAFMSHRVFHSMTLSHLPYERTVRLTSFILQFLTDENNTLSRNPRQVEVEPLAAALTALTRLLVFNVHSGDCQELVRRDTFVPLMQTFTASRIIRDMCDMFEKCLETPTLALHFEMRGLWHRTCSPSLRPEHALLPHNFPRRPAAPRITPVEVAAAPRPRAIGAQLITAEDHMAIERSLWGISEPASKSIHPVATPRQPLGMQIPLMASSTGKIEIVKVTEPTIFPSNASDLDAEFEFVYQELITDITASEEMDVYFCPWQRPRDCTKEYLVKILTALLNGTKPCTMYCGLTEKKTGVVVHGWRANRERRDAFRLSVDGEIFSLKPTPVCGLHYTIEMINVGDLKVSTKEGCVWFAPKPDTYVIRIVIRPSPDYHYYVGSYGVLQRAGSDIRKLSINEVYHLAMSDAVARAQETIKELKADIEVYEQKILEAEPE